MTEHPTDQAERVLRELKALAPEPQGTSDALWLAAFRCQVGLMRGLGGDPEPLHAVDHLLADGVPVRLYRPAAGRLPVLLHLHGGGGIAGSVDAHDSALRRLAARTGWLVAAPDYRLAPEHRFPAQLEDGHAALRAVSRLAGVDASRLVVAGDSIGGTLATALAMLARERGGPALAGQVLLYPNIDLRRGAAYPSRRTEEGRIVAAADLERQIGLYLADDADRASPLASPITAPREVLATLPPAFVATGGNDPLRDEGELYARRLAEAGVATRHHRFDGMIHGFFQMGGRVDATDRLLARLRGWLDRL